MNGEFIAWIKQVPEQLFTEMFEEERRRLERQITAVTDAELPQLKAKVAHTNELEGRFKEARKK